jgi:glycosyltransferase involved in cell wall biosynthesis
LEFPGRPTKIDLRVPFSVLILTHDEAKNVRVCIDSLRAASGGDLSLDIAVIDSGSTDGTVEIVRKMGIPIYERSFDTFAQQRNWGMDSIPWTFEWILHLDADERVDRNLITEIAAKTRHSRRDAYLIANRLFFMGKWIRYSSRYPHYQARLLHRHRARFMQRGHGQYLDDNCRDVGRLRHPYDHFNFSKGISEWVEKHNRYSTAEAEKLSGASFSAPQVLRRFIGSRNREASQQAMKAMAASLPFRPLARFLYLYCWKWGFLDGRPGFDYCVLMAFYEFLISLKQREKKGPRP